MYELLKEVAHNEFETFPGPAVVVGGLSPKLTETETGSSPPTAAFVVTTTLAHREPAGLAVMDKVDDVTQGGGGGLPGPHGQVLTPMVYESLAMQPAALTVWTVYVVVVPGDQMVTVPFVGPGPLSNGVDPLNQVCVQSF